MTLHTSIGHRLSTSLGVRADEVTLTLWMTALFAMTQASHAVGANTADALFFLRYGVEDLPLTILLSGLAVMAALLAHATGLARWGAGRWLVATMAIASLWVGGLWASLLTDNQTVYPVIWVSTQVSIFLTLTAVWNAGGMACTTRQAKRLFPAFATAAVAGGVLGNLAVGPAAELVGTPNLLLVQAALLVGATLLMRRVATFFQPEEKSDGVRVEMARAFSEVRSSNLMKLAAGLIFLLFALFFMVVFPFSEAVAGEFSNEAELAGFLGLFSSFATAATFAFSLFVTRRLFSRLGLVISLALVPAVYVLGFSSWLIAFGLVTAALVRGLQWVAVNAVQATAYNAIFNVLSPGRRGAVLALMTAVPAQLGTVAAGSMLLVGANWPRAGVFIAGLIVSALSLALVLAMRPAYLAAVTAAVRRGLVGLWDAPSTGPVNAVDRDVIRVLTRHLSDPRARARAMAASALASLGDETSTEQVQSLLDDDDALVRAAAFESLCRIEPDMLEPHLLIALSDESPEVRLNALRYISTDPAQNVDIATLVPLLDDPDSRVRAAAAWQLAGGGGESVIHEMLASGEVEAVGSVLTEMARHDPSRVKGVRPSEYLDHPDPAIRVSAIGAYGVSGGDPATIVHLLDDRSVRVRRAAALQLAASESGRRLMFDVLEGGSVVATEAALSALTPVEDPDFGFIEWAAGEARRASYLAGHGSVLERNLDSLDGRYLVRVLDSRVDRLIRWVLVAMTTRRNRDVMSLVARGVGSDDQETRSQALEALESVGDRPVVRVLIPLLEPLSEDFEVSRPRDSLEALAGDFDFWVSYLATRCLQADPSKVPGEEGLHHPDVAGSAEVAESHADTLDDMGRVLVLQQVPMFSKLDPEDLMLVARSTTEVRFDGGDQIYREGEPGNELLVIVTGTAVVSVERGGETRPIDAYGPGDHVGELSLLTGGPRSADVYSGPDGLHGLVITKTDLLAILDERPTVAVGMIATLAARLIEQT